ncbi:MAG: toll/interleukin-1 receptor domain-containing protein [Burkholderiales bacterium]|nr:toll/interleukin-1 receptor domain-containing protein [Phycisphaerae bacterium]
MAKPKRKSASYRVFVSHASTDKWLATVICEKLEASGISTFRDDRDLAGGDDIPDEIRRAILNSDELLVLLTPDSVDRRWVLMEIGAAWLRGPQMRIIALRCHIEIDPIPDILKSKKVYSINDFDRMRDDIVRRSAK